MSLQTRLTDLVGAIGADIKSLSGRVATVESIHGPVAAVTQEVWHKVGAPGESAVFTNGWTAYSGAANYTAPAFKKDPAGRVHLKGIVKGGTLQNPMFTLPPGYCPLEDRRYIVYGTTDGNVVTPGLLFINRAGQVTLWTGATFQTSLDEIVFDTDQTTFPAGKSIIPVVPALPVGSTDGDEVYFQTTEMEAAGIPMWRLRYRGTKPDGTQNTNTHKWEPVGVGPYPQATITSETTPNTNNVATDFTTSPLSWALPLAGYYVFAGGAALQPLSNSQANLGLYVNGVNQYGDTFIGTGPYGAKLAIPEFTAGAFAKGDIVKLRYSTNAGSITWLSKYLAIRPWRVG